MQKKSRRAASGAAKKSRRHAARAAKRGVMHGLSPFAGNSGSAGVAGILALAGATTVSGIAGAIVMAQPATASTVVGGCLAPLVNCAAGKSGHSIHTASVQEPVAQGLQSAATGPQLARRPPPPVKNGWVKNEWVPPLIANTGGAGG